MPINGKYILLSGDSLYKKYIKYKKNTYSLKNHIVFTDNHENFLNLYILIFI